MKELIKQKIEKERGNRKIKTAITMDELNLKVIPTGNRSQVIREALDRHLEIKDILKEKDAEIETLKAQLKEILERKAPEKPDLNDLRTKYEKEVTYTRINVIKAYDEKETAKAARLKERVKTIEEFLSDLNICLI